MLITGTATPLITERSGCIARAQRPLFICAATLIFLAAAKVATLIWLARTV
jgi:hypothetical protein